MSAEGAKRPNRKTGIIYIHALSIEKLPADLGERESEEAKPQTGVTAL